MTTQVMFLGRVPNLRVQNPTRDVFRRVEDADRLQNYWDSWGIRSGIIGTLGVSLLCATDGWQYGPLMERIIVYLCCVKVYFCLIPFMVFLAIALPDGIWNVVLLKTTNW